VLLRWRCLSLPTALPLLSGAASLLELVTVVVDKGDGIVLRENESVPEACYVTWQQLTVYLRCS
jgi:hypothetical protein